MAIGWLVALALPGISTIAAALAKYLASQSEQRVTVTRVTMHDSEGRDVHLSLEGHSAEEIVSLLQSALDAADVDQAEPEPSRHEES